MSEMQHGGAHGGQGAKRGGAAIGHVSSGRQLLAVWGALIVLTGVTVLAAQVDLGSANLWVALAIASVKASLVALYFMHLRYDRSVSSMVFVSSLFFLMLFVGLALMDTGQYQPELIPGYAPAMQETQGK